MKKMFVCVLGLLAGCGGGSGGNGSGGASGPMARVPIDVGTVAFFGESITQLWPLDDYLIGAINAGESGDESWQTVLRMQAVLDKKPRTIVILTGANDIRHLDSADVTNIFAAVAKAKADGIRVIVGTIIPMDINLGGYPDIEKQLVLVMNDKIRKGAIEHGYEVADYHAAMVDSEGRLNIALYADAYLHPNHAGYDAMWTKLEPLLH